MIPVGSRSVKFAAGRPALAQYGVLEVSVSPQLTDAGGYDHVVTVFLGFPAPPAVAGLPCRLRGPGNVEWAYTTNRDGQFRTGELFDGEYEVVIQFDPAASDRPLGTSRAPSQLPPPEWFDDQLAEIAADIADNRSEIAAWQTRAIANELLARSVPTGMTEPLIDFFFAAAEALRRKGGVLVAAPPAASPPAAGDWTPSPLTTFEALSQSPAAAAKVEEFFNHMAHHRPVEYRILALSEFAGRTSAEIAAMFAKPTAEVEDLIRRRQKALLEYVAAPGGPTP